MAILEISEGAAFVFVNLFILVGLVVGFYCSQKIERKIGAKVKVIRRITPPGPGLTPGQ